MARRLLADRIAMIFAVRDIRASGLARRTAGHAAAGPAGGGSAGATIVRPRRRDRWACCRPDNRQHTGNPLGLIELGGDLSSGHWTGSAAAGSASARPAAGTPVLGQSRRLPPDTQLLLLCVAADATGDVNCCGGPQIAWAFLPVRRLCRRAGLWPSGRRYGSSSPDPLGAFPARPYVTGGGACGSRPGRDPVMDGDPRGGPWCRPAGRTNGCSWLEHVAGRATPRALRPAVLSWPGPRR